MYLDLCCQVYTSCDNPCVIDLDLCFQVYMINLERRAERRERMLHAFDILGIDARVIPAVDGKYVVF